MTEVSDTEIILFEEHHRQAVIALWQKCGLTRAWNDPDKDIDRCLSVAASALFLLLKDGVVIGTVMTGYDGHRGAVYYLSVDPDEQGHGYGRRLMAHCEAYLTSLGCPKINLFVRKDNSLVHKFYDGLGYALETSAAFGKRLIPDD
jgi:ribosomal protein S18 acetylase RimI-like enzyme